MKLFFPVIPGKINEGTYLGVELLTQKMMFQEFHWYLHQRPIHNQLTKSQIHLREDKTPFRKTSDII